MARSEKVRDTGRNIVGERRGIMSTGAKSRIAGVDGVGGGDRSVCIEAGLVMSLLRQLERDQQSPRQGVMQINIRF